MILNISAKAKNKVIAELLVNGKVVGTIKDKVLK